MTLQMTILGAGAWGSALGACFARAGHQLRYWRRGGDARALADADVVLASVPAQATREVLSRLAPALPEAATLVLTAKGLEMGTLLRQSQIAAECCPHQSLAVLSGPGFAADLEAGLPTAVTLASTSPRAEHLQAQLATRTLRLYLTDDLTGAELGGALKNVVAIAAGVAMGAGLGESARAAAITRGFAEMVRIAEAAGARRATLMGLSGLGDLTLTATSLQSRNLSYGMQLGADGCADTQRTTEGRATARAAVDLAAALNIDAPLIGTVADLVDGKIDVQTAVERLTSRPLRRE